MVGISRSTRPPSEGRRVPWGGLAIMVLLAQVAGMTLVATIGLAVVLGARASEAPAAAAPLAATHSAGAAGEAGDFSPGAPAGPTRRNGCSEDVPLCACCPNDIKLTCCTSGSDCRGPCEAMIGDDESFHVRLASVADSSKRDLLRDFPKLEVCFRATQTEPFVCTKLSEVRSLTPAKGYVKATGAQLVAGLEIELREGERTFRTAIVVQKGYAHQRFALCDGLQVDRYFGSPIGFKKVRFFLDVPDTPPPARCPSELPPARPKKTQPKKAQPKKAPELRSKSAVLL